MSDESRGYMEMAGISVELARLTREDRYWLLAVQAMLRALA